MFNDICGLWNGSDTSLGQWRFRDISGSVRDSDRPLVQRGDQRDLWYSEGFRDIFGSVKSSEISLGQRDVHRYLWSSEGFRDIFGSGSRY